MTGTLQDIKYVIALVSKTSLKFQLLLTVCTMQYVQCTPKSFLQSAHESHSLLGDGDLQQKEALLTEKFYV